MTTAVASNQLLLACEPLSIYSFYSDVHRDVMPSWPIGQFGPLQPIEYRGSFGAMPTYQRKSVEDAFRTQTRNGRVWVGELLEAKPAGVWTWFDEPIVLAKIAFSTRNDNSAVNQAPEEFDVIGTDDCTTDHFPAGMNLLHVSQAGFSSQGQEKEWEIPIRSRARFSCIGIFVRRARGSANAALHNVRMWKN